MTRELTASEALLVKRIRKVCALELGVPETTRFFHMSYAEGLSDDEALLRLFRDESDAQAVTLAPGIVQKPTFERVIRVLCHG